MAEIVITTDGNCIYSGLLSSTGKIIEIQMESKTHHKIIGNIYVGKVTSMAKGINAAFIDIGLESEVFMPIEPRQKHLFTNGKSYKDKVAVNDELVVQVVKEGDHNKAPKVTPHINVTGEHVVLTFGNVFIGVSNKIEETKERKRLKNCIMPYKSKEFGFIVRTNALHMNETLLENELLMLTKRYEQITGIMKYRPFRSCLYEQPPQFINFIRDTYKSKLSVIRFDDETFYKKAQIAEIDQDLLNYKDYGDFNLYKALEFKKQIEKGLNKMVWLKSGANITIERTEALTAIDVNSGKINMKKGVVDFFYKVNMEAAIIIMHQLRLRNISGIIIIDFIDMPSEEQKLKLLEELRRLANEDRIKTEVIDITKLGLVELTRKKVYKSLEEQIHTLD
ncbi:MAG: ribonuclease E/G [Vallitaleaceae bacterium]|jgi:ribonuclease G|nr:ribonuclease E/G [Vallitaleaceae bacterium]